MIDEPLDPIEPQDDNLSESEPVTPQPEPDMAQPAEPVEASVPLTETPPVWAQNRLDLSPVYNAVGNIKSELRRVIIGQDKMIDLLIASIFCNGHVLIEGVPGIAKTLTARMLAQTLATDFSRIQFTPDLMPSDVVGTTVFNMKT